MSVKDLEARSFYMIEASRNNWSTRELDRQISSLLFERIALSRDKNRVLELGRGFALVARQRRITVGGEHFYIDLVFFNHLMRCFVLIDLKIGKLDHRDIGQMDFYVRYFEKEVKAAEDNPTIGLILCSERNEAAVKYTLLSESEQIFAPKYRLCLPTEEELKREIAQERARLEQDL